MTQTLRRYINDYPWARWTALLLVSSLMFFAYMFEEVMSPLQSLVEIEKGWSPEAYGLYGSGEYIFNVVGFLIVAGIILDKFGVRVTGTVCGIVMALGGFIKWYALSDAFCGTMLESWLNSWWIAFPASAKLAAFGFLLFGSGVELGGTAVHKAISKWFKGKELGLAMAIRFSITRVSVVLVFIIAPIIANKYGSVVQPVAFFALLNVLGVLGYLLFCVMDSKLDRQLGKDLNIEKEDQFKAKDMLDIFKSKVFWLISGITFFYFSASLPIQKYATNMLESDLGLARETAAMIFSWYPLFAAALTPVFGTILDRKGKGATMLIWGPALLGIDCLIFAFVLPVLHSTVLAVLTIALLGLSFSILGASIWPAIPKVIEEKVLGSAFCLVYWIQNFGLCIFPPFIGWLLEYANPGVAEAIQAGDAAAHYSYTWPMFAFALCGIFATIMGVMLKIDDRKKGFGLEMPNIQ